MEHHLDDWNPLCGAEQLGPVLAALWCQSVPSQLYAGLEVLCIKKMSLEYRREHLLERARDVWGGRVLLVVPKTC